MMSLTRRESIKMALSLTAILAAQGQIPKALAANQVETLSDSDLKRDAEVAWRFFSAQPKGTKKGLVPAAVWPEGSGYGQYAILTMWDTGSIILAYVSALSIGLIDKKEFDERIVTLLAFLKHSEFRWGKLRLPNYRTSIVNNKSVQAGYDSTDTGRLLTALHILEMATGGAYAIKKLIARWDIDGVIKNGQMYDIKSSSRVKSQSNNYIYYIARAHKLWGIDASNGNSASLISGSQDSRRTFLAHVAGVGAIASEPSVNEAIELGHSDESRLLADTLYQAQKKRYAKTGKLTCVSEAPIDSKPWFTYQGFNMNGEGWYHWPVDSVVTAKRWKTEAFANKYRMVNTKAAYLWLAERGDAYSIKLHRHIQSKAQNKDRGFMPGVFEASGKSPMVMDVNTNATALQSIAYVLAGRKPLVKLKL